MAELVSPKTLLPDKFLEIRAANLQIIEKEFKQLEEMHYDLFKEPSSDSLTQLYKIVSTGWAYYERAQYIYRSILLMKQTAFKLKAKFDFNYNVYRMQVLSYIRTDKTEVFSKFRSIAEKDAYVDSFIPKELLQEKVAVDIFTEEMNTNSRVAFSYVEQFKTLRETILMQISMTKSLMLLGNLKISEDVAKSMTQLNENLTAITHEAKVNELPTEEGMTTFGSDTINV